MGKEHYTFKNIQNIGTQFYKLGRIAPRFAESYVKGLSNYRVRVRSNLLKNEMTSGNQNDYHSVLV